MQRIVINTKIGMFSASREVFFKLVSWGNKVATEHQAYIEEQEAYYTSKYGVASLPQLMNYSLYGIHRSDPQLLKVFELYGEDASDEKGAWKLIEIPADIKWYIYENEMGVESVHEEHRVWN